MEETTCLSYCFCFALAVAATETVAAVARATVIATAAIAVILFFGTYFSVACAVKKITAASKI